MFKGVMLSMKLMKLGVLGIFTIHLFLTLSDADLKLKGFCPFVVKGNESFWHAIEEHFFLLQCNVHVPSNDTQRNDTVRNDTVKNDTSWNDYLWNDSLGNDTLGNDTLGNDTLRNNTLQNNSLCFVQNPVPTKVCLTMNGTHCSLATTVDRKYSLACTKDVKTLNITEVTVMDGSVWTCQLSNATSNNLTLMVHKIVVNITGRSTVNLYINVGVLGEEFNLTCTIQHAMVLEDVVEFYHIEQTQAVISFSQSAAHCKTMGNKSENYRGSCSDDEDGHYVKYILTIERIKPDDDGFWKCGLKGLRIQTEMYFVLKMHVMMTLTGSDLYATRLDSFSFHCTVHRSANFSSFIVHFKTSADVFGTVSQNVDQCDDTNSTDSDNYLVTCGEGTNQSLSENKTYTLSIVKPTRLDATIWSCDLNSGKGYSNDFNLKYYGFSLNLTASSTDVRMGGSLNITCTVDNASVMYDDVQFYRKNTLHSSFHQKYDLCSSSVDPVSKMQQLICGEGTSKNMSLTKVYVLYIQMATAKVGSDWHCQLKNDKTLSNTVTLVVIHDGEFAGQHLSSWSIVGILSLLTLTGLVLGSCAYYKRKRKESSSTTQIVHMDQDSESGLEMPGFIADQKYRETVARQEMPSIIPKQITRPVTAWKQVPQNTDDEVYQPKIVKQEDQPKTVDQGYQPKIVNQEDQPKTVDQGYQPKIVKQEDQPKTVDQEDQPKTVDQEVQPKSVDQEVQPKTVSQEVQPKIVEQEDQPKTVDQGYQPKTVDQEDQPKTVDQEDQPKTVDQEDQPKTVDQEDQPKTVDQEDQPKTVHQEDQPKTVDQEDQPKSVDQEDQPKTVDQEY